MKHEIKEVEEQIIVKKKVILLELSEVEAWTLLGITRAIGGSPELSLRRHTDALDNTLTSALTSVIGKEIKKYSYASAEEVFAISSNTVFHFNDKTDDEVLLAAREGYTKGYAR